MRYVTLLVLAVLAVGCETSAQEFERLEGEHAAAAVRTLTIEREIREAADSVRRQADSQGVLRYPDGTRRTVREVSAEISADRADELQAARWTRDSLRTEMRRVDPEAFMAWRAERGM